MRRSRHRIRRPRQRVFWPRQVVSPVRQEISQFRHASRPVSIPDSPFRQRKIHTNFGKIRVEFFPGFWIIASQPTKKTIMKKREISLLATLKTADAFGDKYAADYPATAHRRQTIRPHQGRRHRHQQSRRGPNFRHPRKPTAASWTKPPCA